VEEIPAGRVLQDMGMKAAVRDVRYQQIVNKFSTYSRITRTRFEADRADRRLRVRAQAAALSIGQHLCISRRCSLDLLFGEGDRRGLLDLQLNHAPQY